VRSLGGRVTRELPIIRGFAARVPASRVRELLASPAIAAASRDERIRMAGGASTYKDMQAPNSVWREAIHLQNAQKLAGQGAGVTVALLDTGVRRMPDLGDRVLARVDFTPAHEGYDAFGHGTQMAGLIAGAGTASAGRWAGAAPAAKLVSVKLAGWDGATDVSVVIAGLQWVLAHRDRFGIRVVNLSFGTNGRQAYSIDPLDYAVEQVWSAGILVVTAAGNGGPRGGTITKPGDDPFVLTVGAADVQGTADPSDDEVAAFSSRDSIPDAARKPDLVAPGTAIVSLRAAGSLLDAWKPQARVGEDYAAGSGTSQAAAIVSGVAALMFAAKPSLTPDDAKAALVAAATRYWGDRRGAGAGLLNAQAAVSSAGGRASSTLRLALRSTGLGSLEASRGSRHVYADTNGDGAPERVSGEVDVLGRPWRAEPWRASAWQSSPWQAFAATAFGWGASTWTSVWGGMASTETAWASSDWTNSSDWTTSVDWTSSDWTTWN
jgi:serine protease AprX